MKMVENDCSYDRISINQSGCEIVFTRILGNFAISFNSIRNAFNLIVISKTDAKSVLNKSNFILDEVMKLKSRSQNNRNFKRPTQSSYIKPKKVHFQFDDETKVKDVPYSDEAGKSIYILISYT